MRFWLWLTYKPYACSCGRTCRNEESLARHRHAHFDSEMKAAGWSKGQRKQMQSGR